MTRTRSMRVWKTPRCSVRPTAASRGRSWPACAGMARGQNGRPAPAAWACTRSFRIRPIPIACISPSPRRAHSAPTTAARPGRRSIAGSSRRICRRRRRRSAFASIASRCIPSRPNVVFMQLHQGGGIYRSDNAGDLWQEVNGNLPTDFGFPIDVHAHEANTIYSVPMDPYMRVPPEGKLRVYRSKSGGQRVGAAHQGAAAGELLSSTCCATRWRSIRSTSAAFTSARRAGRFIARRRRRQLDRHRARFAVRAVGRGADDQVGRCHDPSRHSLSSSEARARSAARFSSKSTAP